MAHECVHAGGIRDVTPSALGCEECLRIGSPRVHLRLCRTCGHVGCCDSSPNHHVADGRAKPLETLANERVAIAHPSAVP